MSWRYSDGAVNDSRDRRCFRRLLHQFSNIETINNQVGVQIYHQLILWKKFWDHQSVKRCDAKLPETVVCNSYGKFNSFQRQ